MGRASNRSFTLPDDHIVSTTQDRQHDAPAPEAAPERPRRGWILGAVVLGVGLGAWQGAPRLAPHLDASTLSLPFGAGDDGAHDEARRHPVVQLDDLILNPAGTDGSRFLVLALAMELRGEAGVQSVQERDPAVRDVILSSLAAKTVAELSDATARPALREELREGLNQLLGAGTVVRVYLPRFVIQ